MAYNIQPPLPHQHYRSRFGDTTYTKVFVGGLAWETPIERMRDYFEQFGEILEAVIIYDRLTGKSKGYGFVTFRDPQSAHRACSDPNPMIDGRRANCNIASFGRPRPSPSRSSSSAAAGGAPPSSSAQFGGGIMGSQMQGIAPPHHHHIATSSPFYYSPYGYTAYTPGYGYHHQAIYNPQYQQAAHYYPQLYGAQQSSAMNMMTNPYPYGYAFQQLQAGVSRAGGGGLYTPPAGATATTTHHRIAAGPSTNYVYYHHNTATTAGTAATAIATSAQQMDTVHPTNAENTTATISSSPTITAASNNSFVVATPTAALNAVSQPTTRPLHYQQQEPPTFSPESQAPQRASSETVAIVPETSEDSSNNLN